MFKIIEFITIFCCKKKKFDVAEKIRVIQGSRGK